MKYKIWYFLLGISILLTACNQIQKAADVITQPTAREFYERSFEKGDSTLLQWKNAFEISKKDSLLITLPYSESGIFSAETFPVFSYDVRLREDEKIRVEVEKQLDSGFVFIDFFEVKKGRPKTLKAIKSSEKDSTSLTVEADNYTYYKIIVQPEIKLQVPFVLKIYTEPVYSFPVSGGGNKNIQSFWADPRDAGSRSHEGIDIFAAKGTPLLAVTNGIISSSGEKGLGGKQVWLRDGIFGKTIYYAHLDSIAVKTGKRVKEGDTVGFVGNTGNAITTEPHLHFGIYKGNAGAINPLHYIKKAEIETIKDTNITTKGVIKSNKTELRKGPLEVFPKYALLSKNDTVFVLGKNKKWFHVQYSDSIKGFVQESLLTPLPN